METIKGSISRVVFQSEQSGFKVLKVKTTQGLVTTVTGEFGPEAIVGTIASFHGDHKVHPKYGSSFRVTSYEVQHNAEEVSAIQMFIDAIAPNIGKERSALIVAHFGTSTIDILDNEPDRLLEVEGIGKVSVNSLTHAWNENRDRWKELRQEYSLRAFLNSLGLKERRIKKILGHFGTGMMAEDDIRTNPYRLTEVEGFGFSSADFIAKKLGLKESDPLRLKAYIQYCLGVLCPSEGHLFYTLEEILESINKYSSENLTKFLDADPLSLPDIQNVIDELINDNKIKEEGGCLYSFKNFNFERSSANLISNILHKPSDLIVLTKDHVDAHIESFERESGFNLSEEQKKALYYFAEKKVFVITGLPGTGKCLGIDTPVLMYDGSIKKVQDIIPGDKLMGDDSNPRNVLTICRGRENLYRIMQNNADPYVVNESHILSLKHEKTKEIIDIALLEYLKLENKKDLKGYKLENHFFDAFESDIEVELLGVGDYYGFEIDGNGRFLLGDTTVTHNTTVLKAVVSLIRHLGLHLTCMTPTGISAKRMASTVDYEAFTIHRALGFRGSEWTYNENMKFETDVVLADEASMVDQEVFFRLLSALKTRTHLIFIGDDNQLPSVGAGNVLRELINCGQIPLVRLEQIFRQDEASDIVKISHEIKKGNTDISMFKSDPKADVFFIREKNVDKIEDFIVKLSQKFKAEKRQFQILTPRNDGPLSVNSLNTILQNTLNPSAENLTEIKCRDFILRRGDRIIVKKNDYENSIYNGDIGKVVAIGGGLITIEVDERSINLSIEEVDEKIKLAYSISIHKSQGSEYDWVILPFINQHGKMLLQRNLLYTAITRAKEKVIIIGHGSALERAINNSSVNQRNTKLGERITTCLQMMRNSTHSTLTQLLEQVDSQIVETPKGQSLQEGQSSSPTGSIEI